MAMKQQCSSLNATSHLPLPLQTSPGRCASAHNRPPQWPHPCRCPPRCPHLQRSIICLGSALNGLHWGCSTSAMQAGQASQYHNSRGSRHTTTIAAPACASAGESLTPSPTMATPPAPGRCCSSRILATLPAGITSAAWKQGTKQRVEPSKLLHCWEQQQHSSAPHAHCRASAQLPAHLPPQRPMHNADPPPLQIPAHLQPLQCPAVRQWPERCASCPPSAAQGSFPAQPARPPRRCGEGQRTAIPSVG